MTNSPQNLKLTRFQQRRSNLNESFSFLKETLDSKAEERIRNAAVIKAFEMAFELSWKCLKDILEYKGVTATTPRDVIKEAFRAGYLSDGQAWIELMDHRNELVHVYDEQQALKAAKTIQSRAFPQIESLIQKLNVLNDEVSVPFTFDLVSANDPLPEPLKKHIEDHGVVFYRAK